jgi:hypothetical protein
MTREERKALNTEIAADPRVQAIVERNRRGSIPVYINSTALRSLGYSVPDRWSWTSGGGGGRIQPGLFHNGSPVTVVSTAVALLVGIGISVLARWRRRIKE